VVLIDLQIADGANRQVDRGVLRQQRKHVVEEAHAGGDLRPAFAVERQLKLDLGLGRAAFDSGSAWHGVFTLRSPA
jgi:hypothetical protein